MSDSCDPMDCSPRGFSVRGISQTRILEWVAISFSRGLPHPGIEPEHPSLQADSLPTKPPGKPYISIDLHTCIYVYINIGFPSDSVGKETICNAGDSDSIPGCGRSPGGGNSNPPEYSCLENPMDRGAWQAIVHGVAESVMS